jgi:hypothetical protein
MIDPVIIPIAGMATAVLLVLGIPFVRALTRRWDRDAAQPKVPPEVVARLERIEQAVDAVAIEVERISEGQRFTTKLLSDRTANPPSHAAPAQRAPGAER